MSPETRRRWLVAAAFWTFITALSCAQIYWLAQRPGERINLRVALVWQVAFYLLWIPFTDLVWRMAARWPALDLPWARWIPVHASGALVVGALQSSIVAFAGWAFSGLDEALWPMITGQVRSRWPTQFVVYGAIAAAELASRQHRRWRDGQAAAARLEAQLAEARLGSLRAQLHPHVLFNSLHAIGSLVREGRNADAVRFIGGMSDLLRRLLDAGDALIPVDQEVELARRYLDIQEVRFGDRLRTTLNVEGDVGRFRVPTLTIQPLLENALRHGLSDKVGPGFLAVNVRRHDHALLVSVEDDGVGPPEGWSLGSSTGSGLRTLEARLDAHYRGRASMTAGGRPGGGFAVHLRLPISEGGR